jgi:hypothetical protein
MHHWIFTDDEPLGFLLAMAKRVPLTDQELRDYSKEQVVYEFWMFRAVGEALLAPVQMSQALRNALIESFAIHLRNLIDFFYPTQVQADDVIAAEFFDDPKQWEKLSSVSLTLFSARVRAHKEVSHLTRKRIAGAPPEKGWGIGHLIDEIKRVLTQFVVFASPDKIDPALKSWSNNWK